MVCWSRWHHRYNSMFMWSTSNMKITVAAECSHHYNCSTRTKLLPRWCICTPPACIWVRFFSCRYHGGWSVSPITCIYWPWLQCINHCYTMLYIYVYFPRSYIMYCQSTTINDYNTSNHTIHKMACITIGHSSPTAGGWTAISMIFSAWMLASYWFRISHHDR